MAAARASTAWQPFGASSYDTPGWQRAQARASAATASRDSSARAARGDRRGPAADRGRAGRQIDRPARGFAVGGRVSSHQVRPRARVAAVDGNKLTVDFDKAGRKMVLDSFVERAG